jgi:hypothetical protein
VDARKGIRLVRAPPILTLSLKRFRFDWAKNTRSKITDAFSFPTRTLDLSSYLRPASNSTSAAGAAGSSGAAAESEYELQAVIVHRGTGAGAGHYFAYIRDVMGEGRWDLSRAKKSGGGQPGIDFIPRGRPKTVCARLSLCCTSTIKYYVVEGDGAGLRCVLCDVLVVCGWVSTEEGGGR